MPFMTLEIGIELITHQFLLSDFNFGFVLSLKLCLIVLNDSLRPLRVIEQMLIQAESHHPKPACKTPENEPFNIINIYFIN